MNKTFSLLAGLLLLPVFAGAYGGNYGHHCTREEIKAGKCKTGTKNVVVYNGNSTLGTNNSANAAPGGPAAKGASTPMNSPGAAPPGLPPGVDPAQAAAAMSSLKDAAPVNGKCPDGSTPVPGLNGASRCIPGNLTAPGGN